MHAPIVNMHISSIDVSPQLQIEIKSNICANRFYDHIEEQKTAITEYLDKTFGRWYDDIRYDT
jgi:hypothetical protein